MGPETKLCTLDVLNSDGGLTLGVLSELLPMNTKTVFGRSFPLQMKFSKIGKNLCSDLFTVSIFHRSFEGSTELKFLI